MIEHKELVERVHSLYNSHNVKWRSDRFQLADVTGDDPNEPRRIRMYADPYCIDFIKIKVPERDRAFLPGDGFLQICESPYIYEIANIHMDFVQANIETLNAILSTIKYI